MGKLIGVIVIAAVLWCGWWAIASNGMQRGITQWADTRRAEGWQAEIRRVSTLGFPTRLHARLHDVALADPTTGVAVGMDSFDISAPAYWPGYVTVTLPETPITLASPDLTVLATAKAARADLRLRPGTSLELDRVSLRSGAWALDTAGGSLVAADNLTLFLVQQTAGAPVYDMKIVMDGLVPGAIPRATLGLRPDWPLAFEAFTANMAVAFDTVWDRRALDRRRPQPRQITLDLAQFSWGDVTVLGTGDVSVDDAGLATGSLTVKVENWPVLLDMVENAGYLPPNLRPQAENMLTALAGMSGKSDGLDLTIDLDEGQMSIGFIPLGRAPRIILR